MSGKTVVAVSHVWTASHVRAGYVRRLEQRSIPEHYQFHVDNLSSAHIYVRLRDGETWDNIAEPLLEDCAQLTKANSIEGRD